MDTWIHARPRRAAASLARRGRSWLGGRPLLTLLLALALVLSIDAVDWNGPLLHGQGLEAATEMLRALVHPDLSAVTLGLALEASWRTLAYATAGMALTVVLALPLGVLAAGVLAAHPLLRLLEVAVFRGLLGFLRAVHELVWAWLLVAAIGLTPLAAVWAIALPYAGILGRILAEQLQDVPEGPLRALRAAGASPLQVLLYGRLPYALPDMISYALYRYECAIRSAAIMSFVGLGGLGYQIQLSLADLRYDQVWTFVFFLIGLVVAIDLWSGALRRRLVA